MNYFRIKYRINYFVQNLSFENALAVIERKLNYLKKHGLVEGNVILIYNGFIHD